MSIVGINQMGNTLDLEFCAPSEAHSIRFLGWINALHVYMVVFIFPTFAATFSIFFYFFFFFSFLSIFFHLRLPSTFRSACVFFFLAVAIVLLFLLNCQVLISISIHVTATLLLISYVLVLFFLCFDMVSGA